MYAYEEDINSGRDKEMVEFYNLGGHVFKHYSIYFIGIYY